MGPPLEGWSNRKIRILKLATSPGGLNHWEDYSVMDENTILLEKLQVRPDIPITYYVGGLGGSGKTAYIGLHEVGKIREGETIVISAAAGATGSMVGQIAKLRGIASYRHRQQ